MSNAIDLGFARPVATSATSYPEATDGLMELVGVREVEQVDAAKTPETESNQISKNETIIIQEYNNSNVCERKKYSQIPSLMESKVVYSGRDTERKLLSSYWYHYCDTAMVK